MVVRAVDPVLATLTFYTDTRAAKVAHIAAHPDVAIVAWDASERRQLRAHGTARVERMGAAVDAAWRGIARAGRDAYRTELPPGTAIDAPAARLRDDDGRATFAVIIVTLATVEWLDLAVPGHARAIHTRADAWRGRWLVP